jgi:choline dehydrogenase-like flavoprotein
MLFDFNEAWSRATETTYDVCICGTGPAGITTARKLAARGKKVLLLEGGGLSYSDESEDIYKGRSVGTQYWLIETGRLRYFGGSSNHWQGRCGIFDPIDFEARGYFGLPGWPISRQQVLKGIEEAQEILDISGKNLASFEDPEFKSPFFVRSGYALSPPTRFSEKYGAEIQRSPQIDAFYNANLVDLRLSDDLSRVNHLLIRNYKGQKVEVSASQFVLALGAIENARILLNADGQVPGGIGNHSGMVGRCFMEHLAVAIGRFLVTNPHFWQQQHDGVPLVPTEVLMQQNNIGNGIVDFDPNAHPRSFGQLRLLKQFLRETGCVLPGVANMARQIIDFDCPGDGVITTLIEQAPNPDSRVSLTGDVDALNLRRIQLNWQLDDRDRKTIRVLAVEAAKEMARLDRARVQLAPYILDPHLEIEVGGHAHQMGTTRMSSDPRHGVVDENCRVHGVGNLYIIGSSVFPTGGGTNPTLTIVLLALRLADFLSNTAQL